MTNDSLNREFAFIHYFENKKYSEFPEKWKKHLRRIFPEIKDDTVVHCSKHENYYAKGDVDLRADGQRVIISLKSGKNPCMHKEPFKTFYQDLKDMGVSFQTLNLITLYQFGECKIYGHEDKPLTKDEIVAQYGHLILKANKELNKPKIIEMVIQRAIIIGKQNYREPINYLYYGNLEKGILVSTDQIYQSVFSRKELSSSWIQFGQLVFQPGSRSRENMRYCDSTIHWPVLSKLYYVTKDEDDILSCNIEEK